MKKILKKDISIKIEKIYLKMFNKTDERSFTGRNPPDEIIVIARLKELNILPKTLE